MDSSYGALSNLLSLGVLPQLQVSLTWPSTKENRKILLEQKHVNIHTCKKNNLEG